MSTTLTVRLSKEEAKALDKLCKLTGKSRSELVRDSLRTMRMRASLRASQTVLGPAARAAGLLNEDDVLRQVS